MLGILRRVTEESPRSIREQNPAIPLWLSNIIHRLLSKSVDKRFQSAEAVAELLEKCLAHVQQPTHVPLPDIVGSHEPGNSRERALFATLILSVTSLCLVLMATAWVVFSPDESTKQPVARPSEPAKVAPAEAVEWFDRVDEELFDIERCMQQLEFLTSE